MVVLELLRGPPVLLIGLLVFAIGLLLLLRAFLGLLTGLVVLSAGLLLLLATVLTVVFVTGLAVLEVLLAVGLLEVGRELLDVLATGLLEPAVLSVVFLVLASGLVLVSYGLLVLARGLGVVLSLGLLGLAGGPVVLLLGLDLGRMLLLLGLVLLVVLFLCARSFFKTFLRTLINPS
jgi:hypothetical protein